MSKNGKPPRRVHVVTRSVTVESFHKNPRCRDHFHITDLELNRLHAEGFLEPVEGVREHAKDSEGREPDYLFEWLIIPKVIRYKREAPHRGQSSKRGAYLASEIRRGRDWARGLLEDLTEHGSHKSRSKLGRGGRSDLSPFPSSRTLRSKIYETNR